MTELRYIFLLPDKINRLAGKLAVKYSKKFPSYFVVDNKNLYPHITLFTASQDFNDFKKARPILNKYLKIFKPIELKIKGFEMGKNETLSLKIVRSRGLINFRNKLRDFIEKHSNEILNKNIKYKPHITLTRYLNMLHAKSVINSAKEEMPKSFIVNTVAVGERDKFGQFAKSKKLTKFKIK